MSCYTGFFNVRKGWQSLNTGPRFYLRLIRRTVVYCKIVERRTIDTPNKDNVNHLRIRMSYFRTIEIFGWTHKGHSRNTENTREGHF